MPRMQVYLPDHLYRAVKEFDLPASELLQQAVAAEAHRLEVLARAEAYYAELVAEFGEPTREAIDALRARNAAIMESVMRELAQGGQAEPAARAPEPAALTA